MIRLQVGVAMCVLAAGALLGGFAGAGPAPREPTLDPEELFFDALLRHPERRLESRRVLHEAVLRPDSKARHVLLLGLNELWLAAEDQPDAIERFTHAVLARHWLRRAEKLLPDDDRIPSWRWAAEWAIAAAEHDDPGAAEARNMLRGLAEKDPCFHSVAFAIISFDKPASSAEFKEAHAAMEAAFTCGGDDPSIQDRERWPHNVHGFVAALADFRLKAGDARGAEGALVIAESRPGLEQWRHRAIVTDRLASLRARRDLYANEDPADDPAFVFARGGPASCTGCHGK